MHIEFACSRYTRLQVPTLRKETTATNGKRETGGKGEKRENKQAEEQIIQF